MCNTREETSPADTVLILLDVVTRDNIYQHIFATMSFSSASLQFGYFCKKNPNHNDALEKDIVIQKHHW